MRPFNAIGRSGARDHLLKPTGGAGAGGECIAMSLLPLDGPSATLGELAAKRGAQFHFYCRPCRYSVSFPGEEILARYNAEVLFKHFQRRVICGRCRMPVDGVFRTMEFSSTTDPQQWRDLGLGEGGWGSRLG